MSAPLRMLSLCSGIGGIDLAWEWAGGEVAGQVELDDYCAAVLAKTWPTPRAMPGNISNVNGKQYETSLPSMARKGLLTGEPGKLNPEWVESLMGFPEGWTEIPTPTSAARATSGPSAPRSRNRRGKHPGPSQAA